MQRNVHGQWLIHLLPEAQMILVKGKGGWNYEAAIAYRDELFETASVLSGKSWAAFAYSDDWELGVPESEGVLKEISVWLHNNGCKCRVILANNQMVKSKTESLLRSSGQSAIFVKTIEEAAECFNDFGFTMSVNQLRSFVAAEYPETQI